MAKKLDQVDAEYSSILSEPKSLRSDLKKQIRNFCQMMMMSHLQSPVVIQSEITQTFYQNILDLLNNNYSYEGNFINLNQLGIYNIIFLIVKTISLKIKLHIFCIV